MKYKNRDVRRKLKKLVDQIMDEYDNSTPYKVRVNLLPKTHNAMSQWEKVDNWGNLTKEQIQEAKERGIMHPAGDEFRAYISEIGEHIEDYEDGKSIKVLHNAHNAECDEKTTIVIHEMTPGPDRFKPDGIKTRGSQIASKPKHKGVKEMSIEAYKDTLKYFKSKGENYELSDTEQEVEQKGVTLSIIQSMSAEFRTVYEQKYSELSRKNREIDHYNRIIRNLEYNQDYGRTIAYQAGIYDKGYAGILKGDFEHPFEQTPEIEILMPATASPDQVANSKVAPYIYGIERCVSENQNFHLAIANQAMLSAFVLREMGYDDKTIAAVYHVLPHNVLARNRGACPARMLDASILEDISKERPLTQEEMEIMEEYVPWSVFQALVMRFFERNEFPEELKRKFIYDMSDYDAYMADPEGYNYWERKLEKPPKKIRTGIEVVPVDENIDVIMNVDLDKVEADIKAYVESQKSSDVER